MSSTTELAKALHESSVIRRFFDGIATRYDLINDLLSFRLDHLWRKRALELILDGSERSILDIGTGTGKFIQLFLKKQEWQRACALDFSENMLARAKEFLPEQVVLVQGDFQKLPYPEKSFDLIISAFTLRSVQDLPGFLSGVHRVLTEKGKVGLLCLTRPPSKFWRAITYPYLKYYLPFAGGLLTGNWEAYRFLSNSILTFQTPEKTAEMMRSSGFRSAEIYRMSLGLATLIIGRK